MAKKCRAVSVILYPDRVNNDYWGNVLSDFGLSFKISDLHVFDSDKKPHYHLLIESDYPRDFSFFNLVCRCLFSFEPFIVNDVQSFKFMMEVNHG